jgi:hypothetical protein
MDVIRQLHAQAVLRPEKEIPVPTGAMIGWAPQPVSTLWRREKLFPGGNRTPAIQPVAGRYTN